MKKMIWPCMLLALPLLVLGQLAFAQQATGTFMVVKGDIQVISKAGGTQKAKLGMKVQQSDIIASGADSRAKIVMSDKNVINISPDTKLELEKYVYDASSDNKQVSLNVMYGKVRATVEQKYDGEKNKFHVKTPSAVAGVRGTDFLTGFNPANKETKIVTFEGKVAVGLPGPGGSISNPVYVNPGQTTTAAGGAPPGTPKQVPANELNSMKSESQADTKPTGDTKTDAKGDNKKEEKDKDKKKDKGEAKDGDKQDKADKQDKGEKQDKVEAKEPEADKNAKSENAEPAAKSETAAEAPKQPEPAEQPAGGDAGSNSTAGNTNQSAPEGREPASVGPPPPAPMSVEPPPTMGGSMISTTDLMPSMGDNVINPNIQGSMPVYNFQPTVTTPINDVINNIPKEAIQNTINNTKSNVHIIINRQ